MRRRIRRVGAAGAVPSLARLAAGIGLVLAALAAASTATAGVLDRIKETGALRAGTRADAIPFGFLDANGNLVGFSVDLLEEIRKEAEARLGRPVRLDVSTITAADRIEKIESGQIDIECGITTPTWEREARIDFSVPFFRDGTRVLAYRDTLKTKPEIAQMTIGIARGTTTEQIIAETLPTATVREFPDMKAAMQAMSKGEIDGVANIGVVLLGLSREVEPRRSVVLLPRTETLGMEAMACGLPQNDSAWRDLVNHALVKTMDGIEEFRGPYVDLYDRWFGQRDLMIYPLDRSTRDYLSELNIWAK